MPSSRAIDTQVSIPLIGYNAGLGWRRIPNRLQVPSLKVFPQMWWNKKLFSSGKTSNIRGLNLPQILATVTRKEKNLEGRLISRGDKHLSWRKGSEEKHAFRWVEKSKAICRQKVVQPTWGRCWPGVAQRWTLQGTPLLTNRRSGYQ